MRRTLTALVLFSATLFILQSIPFEEIVVRGEISVQEGAYAEWAQSTLGDFEQGELECTALFSLDDGEVALAREEEGKYCQSGTFTSAVHQSSVLFNVVGGAWLVDKPLGTTFQLEVRASPDRKTWSDWAVIVPDEDGPDTEELTHGNLLEVAPSRYLQYRLVLGTFETSVSPLVREVIFALMNTREGPTVEEARAMVLPQETTSGVPQPRIISRKGWGANEAWATRKPVYRRPTTFVIHHTVTPNNPADPAYIVRAIYQYHALSRGWGDIGYNFLIDRQGNIYEGRKGGDGVVGVHAGGDYNYGSIGIALLGDYRSAQMTPAMKEALISLMAWEADRFNIHPLQSSYFVRREFPNVLGHRDLVPTVCPGDNVYKALPELRQLTWQRLLAHKPRVEIIGPAAGESVSGVIQVQVSSPSPTTSRLELYVDGTLRKEGISSLTWAWNTRQFSQGEHRIKSVATGVQDRTSRMVREVIVDNAPPTGSMKIDDGASYTSQLTVTLSLQAEDDRGEIAGMQFTQDNASEFSKVEEYASSREWVLSSGDGEKTVGVRFLDQAQNASPTYTASIGLDTQPPGDWELADMDELGRVVVEVSDGGSGLDPSTAMYSGSADGGATWGAWQPVSCDAGEDGKPVMNCLMSAEISGGRVRFKIADQAGNEAQSPAYGDQATPTPTTAPGATPTPTISPTATVTPDSPLSELPDLVVNAITVEPQTGPDVGSAAITITIGNQAGVEVENGFWVELSVDPPALPSVNYVAVADGVGAFWYAPRLGAHEVLDLSLQDADERYTNFGGSFSTGTHQLYAYVDAYNPEGEAGLVSELDEANNLFGPVTVEIGDGSDGNGKEPSPRSAGQALRVFLERLESLLAMLRSYVKSQRG